MSETAQARTTLMSGETLRSQLLADLPQVELQLVWQRLQEVACRAGEMLIRQDERANQMYIVRSGVLSLDIATDEGSRHITSLIAGECAGEISLLTGLPSPTSLSALTDAELYALHHADFLELMTSCPTLLRNIGVILSQRLAASERGKRIGITDLMRIRVHPSLPPELPERLARAVAQHLAMPLLVLDHRQRTTWDESERVPDIEQVTANREVLERLRPERPWAILAAPTRELPLELWTRFEKGLPEHVTHVLVIRPLRQQADPQLQLGGARPSDITLWPAGEREVPEHVGDIALVVERPEPNSRSNLERLRAAYRHPVVCTVAPDQSHGDAAIGWLARHLAHLKVGLALGGGGARGFSHLGVVRGLQQIGVPIDYVTGCSIGAIVAACYAFGFDVETIGRMMAESTPHLVKLTVPRHSLLSRGKWERYFRQLSGDRRLEDAGVPCAVVASDVLQRKQVILDRGPVWKTVLASAAIPGIYPPMWIDGHCLFDGALLDPVPTACVRALGADAVLGVSLMGTPDRTPVRVQAPDDDREGRAPNLLDTIMRSFDLSVGELSARTAEGADVTIVPEVEALGIKEFQRGRTMLPAGERALEQAWPQVRTLLPWLREVEYRVSR